jgi:hypothetical protein
LKNQIEGKSWLTYVKFAGPLALLAVIVAFAGSGKAGFQEVDDSQVSLTINYLTGNSDYSEQPGIRIFIPIIQEVFTFDKSPNKFVMKGKKNISDNDVKQLEVRANDGSIFWFEELEIQYKLVPSKVAEIIQDSGAEEAFKGNWMKSYARSVLRDAFGRYSAEEIANPTTYKAAKDKAQERLEKLLEPHGITIVQIVTPKPKFHHAYETAIEQRKLANQEVQRLIAKLMQLEKEKDRRLASIERDKYVNYESLLGALEAERITAETQRVKLEKSADAAKIMTESEGKASEAKFLQEARGLNEKYLLQIKGLKAQAEALALQGEVIVRETLARKLAQIEFTIIPYSKDSHPKRIEYSDVRKGASK